MQGGDTKRTHVKLTVLQRVSAYALSLPLYCQMTAALRGALILYLPHDFTALSVHSRNNVNTIRPQNNNVISHTLSKHYKTEGVYPIFRIST
jgi:hypothetical protein